MNSAEKYDLITRGAIEVVTASELKALLESVDRPRAYIGFEPSGLVHVGWLIWMNKVRDFINAGVDMYVLEATWHAYINDKLGGNMDLIRMAAKFVRKIMEAYGINVSSIKFVDAEDLVSDKEYWGLVIKSAKNVSLARVKRALTIMGRRAGEAESDASKIIYPLMQVVDIIYLNLDIALGGTDQRKAHMLQRDIAEKMGLKKVVAVHTPLLVSLSGPERKMSGEVEIDDYLSEVKMSKSKPETAIFAHDTPEEIELKIAKAYCPPREVELNPVIQLAKYILFSRRFTLRIERPMKYGGDLEVNSFSELEKMYVEGAIHPQDLKKSVARALTEHLKPIRAFIERDQEARELLEKLSQAKITR